MEVNPKTRVLAIGDALTRKEIAAALNSQEFETTPCGQGEIVSTVTGSPRRFHVVVMADALGHLDPQTIVNMLNDISALPSGVVILTSDARWQEYARSINARTVASALYCTVLVTAVRELGAVSPRVEIDPSRYAESPERHRRRDHHRRHRS